MWRNIPRKCARFVNLTILTSSGCQTTTISTNSGVLQRITILNLLSFKPMGKWVQQQIDEGWDGYFVHLPVLPTCLVHLGPKLN